MARFVLIPGAGGGAWVWKPVLAELARQGHDALALELPGADPGVGLAGYRDLIVRSIDDVGWRDVTLVAHSLGAFSAPLACDAVDVREIVLVNGMVPAPGESADDWWDAVGWESAARAAAARDGSPAPNARDVETMFLHDLSATLTAEIVAMHRPFAEASRTFEEPWPLASWPVVPTRAISSTHDRLFPLDLQRRIAAERLGEEAAVIPGGHMAPLSQPRALVGLLTTGLINAGTSA